MTSRRLARLVACAGVVAAAACIDITVSGSELGSLQFFALPYPSVDENDTLRDADDKVAQLQATAFRLDKTPDPDIPITFLALDTAVTIRPSSAYVSGRVLADTQKSDTGFVIASAEGLQSTSQRLFVVRKADTLVTNTPVQIDTIEYSIPATTSDVSVALAVKVGKKGAPTGSQGYLVRYLVKRGTVDLPANDTSLTFVLEGDQNRLSKVDTTDAAGVASRVLRFRIRAGQAPVDTVTVLAEAVRGSRMKTDTIKWTVVVRPK